LSARNQTNVAVTDGNSGAVTNYTLNAGEFVELLTTSAILVNADKPIQGMQLSQSQGKEFVPDPNGGGGPIGDPMMVGMPTTNTDNWQTNVNLFVGSEPFAHYVTLVSRDFFMSSMTLNGNAITGWQYIGSSRFKFVRVALAPGNNVINGVYIGGAIGNVLPAKFMALGYGFALYDAKGSVSGGLALANNYVNVHPNDPTNLVATAFSSTEIDLAWTDNATNEYGYRIERKTETGNWGFVADRAANTVAFRDSGLTKKTKYYYRVFAYADEDSSPSNTANAITLNEKPVMPTGLGALALSATEIKLSWTDISDNEDSFMIERRLDGSSVWEPVKTTDPNAITWTDSGLTKKTKYFYQIKSVNEVGSLGWTTDVNATTKDTKPNKPLALQAVANSYRQITLSWMDDSDNEDGFRIERQVPGGWTFVGNALPNVTSLVNHGLTGGTEYTYRAFAYNNGGDSEPSNLATATTTAPPVPNAPSGLIATGTSQTQILLNWTDNSDCEAEFIIQRSPNGDTGWTEIGRTLTNMTSFLDSGLQAFTRFWYRVQAKNATGSSGWCSIANGKTLEDSPVVGPEGPPVVVLAVASSSSSINVYWNPAKSASGYKLYRSTTSTSSGTLVWSDSATSGNQRMQMAIDSGLTSGTEYYYRVSSVSDGIESAKSSRTSHHPNASAMPLNGSAYELAQWAVSHQPQVADQPSLGVSAVTILLPDNRIVRGASMTITENPVPMRLEREESGSGLGSETTYSNSLFASASPESNVGCQIIDPFPTTDKAGGQLNFVSPGSAHRVHAEILPSVASYASPGSNSANPVHNANADSILNFWPIGSPTTSFASNVPGIYKEAQNFYVGFQSFNSAGQINFVRDRGNRISDIEMGFQMDHFGQDFVQAFRFTPYFRSSVGNTGDNTNGVRFTVNAFAEANTYIRADVPVVPGLNYNAMTLEGLFHADSKQCVGCVSSPSSGLRQLLIGLHTYEHTVPTALQHEDLNTLAKIGCGLDQVVSNVSMLGPGWRPEVEDDVYFKRGHLVTGSKIATMISNMEICDDPDGETEPVNNWQSHHTLNVNGVTFGGIRFLIINNN
jgi:IgGFc binding protein